MGRIVATVDIENFSEIGSSMKLDALVDTGASYLKNQLIHLLKWAKQKQRRSGSWRDSIDNARDALADLLQDSPSLRPQLPAFVKRQYPRARRSAANQTGLTVTRFPATCPFRLELGRHS